MNLTDVLKEASIIDHSWWGNGMLNPGEPTFNPEEEGIRKRNNTKPELEVEWGNAGPNVNLDEPAGVVERNIPEEDLADAKAVIMFARDMMNRGAAGPDIVRELKAKYDKGTLRKAKDGLRKQFALDGIVGCIAVDGRGYKSCHDAIKVASCSPHKGFIKYVIGCQCGDPHLIPANERESMGKIAESTGNAMDDFLGSDNGHKAALVSHCRSTMLPILSFRGDLDQSDVDQTLVTLMNVGGLPESHYSQLWDDRKNNKLSSNLEVVRAAFRRLNARKLEASKKYAQPVNPSEYMLGVADNPVEIGPAPVADLGDVDGSVAPLDAGFPTSMGSLDVDMDLFMEPEFEGMDEVSLEDVQAPQGPLDIDIRQDMRI